jgi:hypothetical protein
VQADRGAGLGDGAAVNGFAEGSVDDGQELRAARGHVGSGGEARCAVVVKSPAGDLAVVLHEQGPLPAGDVHFVQVMPGRVAVVEADHRDARPLAGHRVDKGAGAVGGGQVDGRRHARVGVGVASGVDAEDVEVLVAAAVLHVEDVARVGRPEIAHHGADVGGEQARRLQGLIDGFDPEVHHAVVRPAEGDVGAVRRELRAASRGSSTALTQRFITPSCGRRKVT